MARRSRPRSARPNPLDRSVIVFGFQQESEDWHDWTGRWVTLRRVQEMLAAGEVRSFETPEYGMVYRETQQVRSKNETPCSLTLSDLLAAAGLIDSERLTARVVMWPFVESRDPETLAIKNPATVGPRYTDADLIRAQALLEKAWGIRRSTSVREERAPRTEVIVRVIAYNGQTRVYANDNIRSQRFDENGRLIAA